MYHILKNFPFIALKILVIYEAQIVLGLVDWTLVLRYLPVNSKVKNNLILAGQTDMVICADPPDES